MNTYYIGGMPITDELYHHGIQGQKWGIRRYQNEDGSLTDEGKKRYGHLGEYADKHGLGRRLITGDWALGRKRIGERIENRYERKSKKAAETGNTEKAEKYKDLQRAQWQRNVDREKYQSYTSTGKMLAQNILLGIGADSYRVERNNQTTRGKAAVAGILTYAPYIGQIAGYGVDAYKSKKRYGHITI